MIRKIRTPVAAAAGFMLVDAEWKVVYADQEAKRILAYPAAPHRFDLARIRLQNIFPAFTKQNSASSSTPLAEFMSGRRKYVSRTFRLTESKGRRSTGAVAAVLLERSGTAVHVITEICERYRLTERERAVVELLVQGLTNKEIAVRMTISPNTVRAFVRMVMVKLSVSTRSGIVGIVIRTMHAPTQS